MLSRLISLYRKCRMGPAHNWPGCIQLELLNVCNLRCPLCRMSRISGAAPIYFPLDAVYRMFDSLSSVPRRFSLYGRVGEPLLHPEIVPIIHTVHSRGSTKSRISTNGMALNGRLMEEIIDSPLTELLIAVDAATPATYRLYRRGGDFDRLCRNIEAAAERRSALGRRRPRIIAQFIPMRQNENELDAFLELARRLGCDEARIKISGSVSRNSNFRPRDETFSLTENKANSHGEPCRLDEVYVDCKGNVFPCCYAAAQEEEEQEGAFASLRFGNLYESDWRGMRRTGRHVELRRLFDRGKQPPLCLEKCVRNVNRKVERVKFRK